MWSQVGLRKHHYEQSWWEWWNSNWAISNPKRWFCESATLKMPANWKNSAVATGLEKVIPVLKCLSLGFSFQPQKEAMPKNVQTTAHLHLSDTLAEYCSKFPKLGFSSTWTENFQMFKLDLEKAEEPEIKLPTSTGSLKKQESSRKTSTSVLLTMPKPLIVWITTNCGIFLNR